MVTPIEMNEEDVMDDEIPQTVRSESAFSGTSDERTSVFTESSKLPFEVQCKAYLVKESGKVRFDIWEPSLEKRSGVTFEDGRMYVVRGTIIGVKQFESRHVASGNPHVYVFPEGDSGVVPGQRYRLLVEGLEEKRKYKVLSSARGPTVRLSRRLLERFGVPTGESSIVELGIKRLQDLVARRVYVRWNPCLAFVQLHLGSLGFVEEDEVEVVSGRRYDVGGFVEDFRVYRLNELANVELGVKGGSLMASVDGKRVHVERHWLMAHGLKAALKVELGHGHRMMKFVFDGSSVEARFGNSDPLLEWSAIGGGVDVRYSRGAGQAYVMRLDQGHLPKVAHSLRWLLGGIRVIERPNVSQGVYLLGMSEEIREITRQKLNETVDGKAYARLRGDIGEGVVRLLLPRMRMELLYDHPWSDLSHRLGSLRHGPDFMANCQDSGLAVYVEVKWWENVLEAFRRGGERVGYYVHSTPVWRGIKLDGGYIAVLDWKLGKTAKLWVERVV